MSEYIMKVEKDMDGIDCYIPKGGLVRCKDCKHWTRIIDKPKHGACDRWCTLNVTKADDYCSRAEQDDIPIEYYEAGGK